MIYRRAHFVGLFSVIVALSAYSFAFARGGGGPAGGEIGHERGYSRPESSRVQAEDRQPSEAARPAEIRNSDSTGGADNEAARSVITNPFVNPAAADVRNPAAVNRAEYDRGYPYYGYPFYWGPLDDWTTNTPPPSDPASPAPTTP